MPFFINKMCALKKIAQVSFDNINAIVCFFHVKNMQTVLTNYSFIKILSEKEKTKIF